MAEHELFNKKLIEEVKKYEFIYNMAHPDRRRGTTSQEKWSEIASAVESSVKKCKSRWSSLRRRYESEYLRITSGSDGKEYESDWKHMDAMAFLEGYIGQDEHFLENLSKLSKRDIFCRTCLCSVTSIFESSSDSYNIFGKDNFAEKLMQCTNIDIVPWDKYPHSVCKKCYQKVLDFCRFQDMCRESLEKFDVMLKNQTDVKCDNYEEEISDSYFDSVIEYTVVDSVTTQRQPGENHTASVDEVEHFHENSEYQKDIECESGIREAEADVIDPLEEHTKIELVLEEELELNATPELYVASIKECSKISKTKRSVKRRTTSEETDTTDETNQVQISFNDDNDMLKSPQAITEEVKIEIQAEDESECSDEVDEENDEKLDYLSDDKNSVLDDSEVADVQEKNRSRYPLKCDLCPKVFRYSHRLEAHQRRHRGQSEYPCTFENCSRGFNRLTEFRDHINDHNGVPNVYKCTIDNCDVVFPSNHLLYKHKLRDHKNGKELKKYSCETCGKVITTLRSLQCHRYIHLDKSKWPYGCDIEDCTERFRILAQKKIHLKRHAGIKDYICPHCGMRKTTSSELSIHINLHTFEKKYPCRICSKVFKSVGSMSTHIRVVHEGKQRKAKSDGLYKCSYCDRKLSSAHTKKYHEMTHTGEKKPYECDECDKTFVCPALLKQHQIKHVRGEKPYVCEECGVRYKWPLHLKTHMKIHLEGANPFPCDICGKRFKWQSNLKSHILLHNEGSTPYTCEECGKGFRWPGSFYNHKKAHMKKNMDIKQKEVDMKEVDIDP